MERTGSLIAVLAVLAMSMPLPVSATERLQVFVSLLPQKYFVEKIGGDFVDVQVMVAPGASPASYEPKPLQMARLVDTRIYFAVGVPFEATWLQKISGMNPDMAVVHTESSIARIPMATEHFHDGDAAHSETETHPEDGKTSGDSGLDPHIWLSPPLVKVQVESILAALVRIDPGRAGIYEENSRRFISEIDALDSDLRALFQEGSAVRFMVFHPSWGYFAEAYGLEQVAIEIEGKEPKPAQLKSLIEHARREEIRVIFVQPQFSSKSAELIAREIDGHVAVADPLAEDWIDNLKRVAETFRDSMR
jgi:zinc transport system substrate-binding protein